MNDKKLQRLAKKIAALENDVRKGKNADEAEAKIEELIADLSLDELIALDEMTAKNL